MGIENIQILYQVDADTSAATRAALQVQAVQEQLIADHRRGMHPYGNMIRACPLCQRE